MKRTDEYHGIEPYPSVFESTTNRLGLNKNRVLCISAQNLMENQNLVALSGTFDTIMMVSVFEHLSNPMEVLKDCHTLSTEEENAIAGEMMKLGNLLIDRCSGYSGV